MAQRINRRDFTKSNVGSSVRSNFGCSLEADVACIVSAEFEGPSEHYNLLRSNWGESKWIK
jgi:hypothetical protein